MANPSRISIDDYDIVKIVSAMRHGDVLLVECTPQTGFDVFKKKDYYRIEHFNHVERKSGTLCEMPENSVEDIVLKMKNFNHY